MVFISFITKEFFKNPTKKIQKRLCLRISWTNKVLLINGLFAEKNEEDFFFSERLDSVWRFNFLFLINWVTLAILCQKYTVGMKFGFDITENFLT